MNVSNSRPISSRPLTILSLNVGRGAQTLEIALIEAHSIYADTILIQEPNIFQDLTRRITKKHPSYDTFSPVVNWSESHPRVVSYVHKGVGLQSEQLCIELSSDLFLLRLFSSTGQSIKIFNVYNAPLGNSGISSLTALDELPHSFFKWKLQSSTCMVATILASHSNSWYRYIHRLGRHKIFFPPLSCR